MKELQHFNPEDRDLPPSSQSESYKDYCYLNESGEYDGLSTVANALKKLPDITDEAAVGSIIDLSIEIASKHKGEELYRMLHGLLKSEYPFTDNSLDLVDALSASDVHHELGMALFEEIYQQQPEAVLKHLEFRQAYNDFDYDDDDNLIDTTVPELERIVSGHRPAQG